MGHISYVFLYDKVGVGSNLAVTFVYFIKISSFKVLHIAKSRQREPNLITLLSLSITQFSRQ